MSIKFNPTVASLIICLFFPRCPTAVFGRVWTVIVNAVEGVFWRRALPHIGYKVLKFLPTLTDPNSATAIIFKRFHFWIATTITHCPPNIINWRMRKSMLAFTTTRLMRAKPRPENNSFCTAITAAQKLAPTSMLMTTRFNLSQYRPTIESLSDNNIFRLHGFISEKYLSMARRICSETVRPTFLESALSFLICSSVMVMSIRFMSIVYT